MHAYFLMPTAPQDLTHVACRNVSMNQHRMGCIACSRESQRLWLRNLRQKFHVCCPQCATTPLNPAMTGSPAAEGTSQSMLALDVLYIAFCGRPTSSSTPHGAMTGGFIERHPQTPEFINAQNPPGTQGLP